jgi:hypothetical protein
MKKMFFFALAAAGMLTACSNEDTLGGNGEQNVSEQQIRLGVASAKVQTRGTGTVGGMTDAENVWAGQTLWVYMLQKGSMDLAYYKSPAVGTTAAAETEVFNNKEFKAPNAADNTKSGLATTADGTIAYYPVSDNYDFWGYRVDDAVVGGIPTVNTVNDAGDEVAADQATKRVVDIKIDGSQDIMAGKAVVQQVRADRQTTFEFKPKILSQNIDINFNIVKNTDEVEFKVTEVWAEISGVPIYIKMNTGYLDIKKTSKMLFKTDIKPSNPDDNGNDTNENKRIACHGNINVTGVVNVQRAYGETLEDVRKKIYGPGIMQVVIYTEVYNPKTGQTFPQKWQGIINLYNTLNKAKLMTTTSDNKYVYRNGEHGTINISAEILLDGKTVGNIDKGGDALDRWIQTDSDINIDI